MRTPHSVHRLFRLISVWLAIGARLEAQSGASTAPTLLPPLKPMPIENVQLLANPGFEESNQAWHLSDWPPRPGTSDKPYTGSIVYSSDVIHTGQRALCFEHGTVGPERLLGISQRLIRTQLAPFDGRRFRLSAWFWLAKGPPYYQGTLGMRQWSGVASGPFGGTSLPIGGSQGEWFHCVRDFDFRLADTQRADVNVWLPNVPEPAQAPRIFVDDVRLEVLADPPLRVELLSGTTLFRPDDRLPFRITVASAVWQQAMTGLRWNVTSTDGRQSRAQGDEALTSPQTLVEVRLPVLPAARHAVRFALGRAAGERQFEILVPFRRADGPFAP